VTHLGSVYDTPILDRLKLNAKHYLNLLFLQGWSSKMQDQ